MRIACKREVKRQPPDLGPGRPVEPRTTSSGSKSNSSGYTATFSIWFTSKATAALPIDSIGCLTVVSGGSVADGYPGRVLIGEVWLPDTARLARYLRPDELHTVFNFPYLCCPWDAARLREVIDSTLAFHAAAGAPPTWVLSNHDVDRHVSRYGRNDTSFGLDRRDHSQPVDLDLGTRRARAAALLTMALPGSVYLYQGEELGLWEVEDIRDELRQDPIWHRTGGADPGRDGSRVPLPWSGLEPPFGFSPPETSPEPWLPQPIRWRELTVEAQSGDAGSMLALYRRALRARRAGFGNGAAMTWLPAPGGVLAFDRGGVACVANLSAAPVELPAGEVVLASGPVSGGLLPPDTSAWLRTVRRCGPRAGWRRRRPARRSARTRRRGTRRGRRGR